MTVISNLFHNLYFLSFLAVVSAYLFSARIYPVVIYLSHKKDLMDEPGERSMHLNKTPTLGGVGLFITFTIGIILMGIFTDLERPDLIKVLALVGSSILLLFLGLKDDLLVISPKKKFSGQLLAATIVVFASDLRILSMDGIFGLGELPYWISVGFTIFVFLLIVNAFNLIDGIDGLAGGIAILTSAFFGVYFALNNMVLMALICFLLIGALIGFLVHNFSKDQKLFMGDSGSLFTGFLMAYLAVGFLNNSATGTVIAYPILNVPVMAIAVLSYPMMDVLRVFIIRIREGRSPFSADNNHIHHRFLSLGFSHKKASASIVLLNMVVIFTALALQFLNIHVALLACLGVGIFLYLVPFYAKQKQNTPQMKKVILDKWNPIEKTMLNTSGTEENTVYDDEIARLTKAQQEAVRNTKEQSFFEKRIIGIKGLAKATKRKQFEKKL